jgi:hypothetical protein
MIFETRGYLAGDDLEEYSLIFDLRIAVSQLKVVDSRGFRGIYESLISCIHFQAVKMVFSDARGRILSKSSENRCFWDLRISNKP